MNSANAFIYACSGSYNEDQMNKYSSFVNQNVSQFQQMGGWLAEQANKTLDGFNTFLNSKAWELGKRLLNKVDGDYVGRFDIGYLGSLEALQGAQGFMRDYVMAHTGVMQGYLDETLEGYGGEFSAFCTGVGEENLFYRRAMDGVLNLTTVDDKPSLQHTHYYESVGGGLSFRQKVDIHKTWCAIDSHMAKSLFDVTSPDGKKIGKKEVVE